jgi:hypothetical protein
VSQPASPTIQKDHSFVRPSIVTILGSYRCTAECKHCCFDSNPRIKERLSLQEILCFIESASQYRQLQLVVFSGGECFLLGEDLNRAVSFCKSKGLRTRCVTNGYWAKSLTGGRQRLQGLKDDGLDELNISTGDFHQEHVSASTIVSAARLSVEIGIENTLIVVEMRKTRQVSKAQLLRDHPSLGELEALGEPRFRMIESPWMPMSINEHIDQDSQYMLNRDNVHLRTGCSSINTTIVLTPRGKVGLCCGLTRELIPELNETIGERTLDDILRSSGHDFMKIWLFVDGPERILAWAASKNAAIDWENKYSHHCHVCLSLFDDELVRETIREHYLERVDDVLLRYSLLLHSQLTNSGNQRIAEAIEQTTAATLPRLSGDSFQLVNLR